MITADYSSKVERIDLNALGSPRTSFSALGSTRSTSIRPVILLA
jgi:hypothetical protein